MGQLHSLTSLNMSRNFLTDLTLGGLAGCDALRELDVSRNLLADVSNIEHLALIPSLLSLRMAGNPLAEDKYYRCVWRSRKDCCEILAPSFDRVHAFLTRDTECRYLDCRTFCVPLPRRCCSLTLCRVPQNGGHSRDVTWSWVAIVTRAEVARPEARHRSRASACLSAALHRRQRQRP